MVCSRCGNLRSVCSNPDVDWHPGITVCYSAASVEWGKRRLQAKYADQPTGKSDELHFLDGVSVWAADIEVDDGGEFDLQPLDDQVGDGGDQ